MRVSNFLCLVIVLLVLSPSVSALPLNAYNEIRNPGFDEDLAWWQHGADVIVASDGPIQGYTATCKATGGDLWLRQIVDDSLSPNWNWTYDRKIVDLIAKITWVGWEPPMSTVSFRIDWWSADYNNIENPETLPYNLGPPPAGPDPAQGYFVTEWVTYDYVGIPAFQWVTVNPFDRILLPEQQRWISVEIVFGQAPGQSVWLDDVVLTGKCVPEPCGLMGLFGGTGMALAACMIRRLRN